MNRAARILDRALRLRCPFCGRGRLFRTLFRIDLQCAHCGLRYRRERGYFSGGMELHWLAIYLLPMVGHALFPHALVWMAAAAAVALILHRHARAVWMALDHIVDSMERELASPEHLLGGSRDDCPCTECRARRAITQ